MVLYEDCGNFQTAAAPQADHLIQKIEKDKIINTNRFHSFISYLLKLYANPPPPPPHKMSVSLEPRLKIGSKVKMERN